MNVRLVCFLIGLGCLTPTHARSEDEVSREVAIEALHRAVHFFRTKASSHGGYVFRVSADLTRREGEERVGDSTAWIEPPATPAVGQAYLDAYIVTGDNVLLDAAKETAQALLRGQLVSGGWDNLIEFAPDARRQYAYRVDSPDAGKRRNFTTFDDDKTQSVIRFLMRLDETLQMRDPVLHEAVIYALDGVLRSQYANGAWPQRYSEPSDDLDVPVIQASYPSAWSREFPNDKYTGYYTLNDGTLSDLVTTLSDASDIYGDERYFAAAKRGGDFLLLAQMPAPQPGWAQQYDRAMHPAWARKFEPPAISGGESQQAMQTLLKLYRRTADQRYLAAVKNALAYYRTCLRPDGRLARFYELETNRPLYMTRQYELTYSDADVPTHYGFIVKSSLDRIQSDLDEVSQLPPDKLWRPSRLKPPKPSTKFAKEAAKVVATLDDRGAWVEQGKMNTHPDANVSEIIASKTFIDNLETLAMFIASTPR